MKYETVVRAAEDDSQLAVGVETDDAVAAAVIVEKGTDPDEVGFALNRLRERAVEELKDDEAYEGRLFVGGAEP